VWVATRYDGTGYAPSPFLFVVAYELIREAHDLAKVLATPQVLNGCAGCRRETCPLHSDGYSCPAYLPKEIKYLGGTFTFNGKVT
jgi:hypothetical protein